MAICTSLAQKICDILIAVRRLDRSSQINVKLQGFRSCKRFLIDGKVDLSGGGLSIKGNQLGAVVMEARKCTKWSGTLFLFLLFFEPSDREHFSFYSIFGTKSQETLFLDLQLLGPSDRKHFSFYSLCGIKWSGTFSSSTSLHLYFRTNCLWVLSCFAQIIGR